MNTKRNTLAIALTASLSFAGHAQAQSGQREVFVNGEHMNALELVVLDAMNCGQSVPSGRYWINWVTRTWGYEGVRKASPLPDCAQAAQPRQQTRQQARSGGSGGHWEDRVHESLCVRNGHCGVDIVINPVYQ